MKKETVEEMKARISQQIREEFKQMISTVWLYQANENVHIYKPFSFLR